MDAQGIPTNIRVDESSDPKWNDEVTALIREWRFRAALNNGSAVEAHGFIDLTRGLVSPAPAVELAPRKKQ